MQISVLSYVQLTKRRTGSMDTPVKTTRCALCGSSSVVYRNGRYYCVSCGAKGDHPMSDAELAYIDQALSLGDDSTELAALRRRYPRLRVR